MKLLHIDSSITGPDSVSRKLTASVVQQWSTDRSDAQVQYLDLALQAPGHLGADALTLRMNLAAENLNTSQQRENALTEKLLTQFLEADVVVIGAPFYNFSIPSQLKAWIDRIAQAGRTFKYTESGPVGLATGKTVIIVSSRGGIYSTTDAGQAMEHQESYLQTIFGFFGITDIRIVRAEGMALGDAPRASALASAQEKIQAMAHDTRDSAESIAA